MSQQLELDSQFVKRGYWVNLSKGPVMGQTITTDSKTGSIIVALLAVITSLGLTHLWHLFTFAYHQTRANGGTADGHFRHQQALLRTLPSPGTLIADSLKLWMAWKGVSNQALTRTLAHLSTALIFAVGSLVLSIFSSSVVSSSNLEVLVQSPHCGSLVLNATPSWDSYAVPVTLAAEKYMENCYRAGSLPSECNIFRRPRITFNTEKTDCPFKDDICASQAITLDSGLLDVNDVFGTNYAKSDRIRYRRRSTCAVLKIDGYTEVVNASSVSTATSMLGRDVFPGEQIMYFKYGFFKADKSPAKILSLLESNITNSYTRKRLKAWQAAEPDSMVPGYSNPVDLIPQLQRPDADIAVRLVIKGSMKYGTPVNDPLFSAHVPVTLHMDNDKNEVRYVSDYPGGAIACMQQYQYCINEKTCSELGGVFSGMNKMVRSGASETQLAILELFRNSALIQDLTTSERFEAQQLARLGAVQALPEDQWIKELTSWENTVWASHQIVISDYAIGPLVRDPLATSYVLPPSTEAKRKLCGMQKMRKPGGFTNISFFWLLFTIIVSTTVVLIDLVLLRFLLHIRKYKTVATALAPRIDRWLQDGIYQLQRRAHEAQGNGIWKNLTEEVPITADKHELPDLLLETLQVPTQTIPTTPTLEIQTKLNHTPTSPTDPTLHQTGTWGTQSTLKHTPTLETQPTLKRTPTLEIQPTPGPAEGSGTDVEPQTPERAANIESLHPRDAAEVNP